MLVPSKWVHTRPILGGDHLVLYRCPRFPRLMQRCLGFVGQVSFLLLATNRVDRGSREAKRAGGLATLWSQEASYSKQVDGQLPD